MGAVEQVNCGDTYGVTGPVVQVLVIGRYAKDLVHNMAEEGKDLACNYLEMAVSGVEIDGYWVVIGSPKPMCMANDVDSGLGRAHPDAVLPTFLCHRWAVVIIFLLFDAQCCEHDVVIIGSKHV